MQKRNKISLGLTHHDLKNPFSLSVSWDSRPGCLQKTGFCVSPSRGQKEGQNGSDLHDLENTSG
jgi:hypothetical protein